VLLVLVVLLLLPALPAEELATSMVVSRKAQSSSCSSLGGVEMEEEEEAEPPEQVVQVEEEDAVDAAEEGGTRVVMPDVAVSKVSMVLVWIWAGCVGLCVTGRARGRARGEGGGKRCDAGNGRATDARDGGLLLQKLLQGHHLLRQCKQAAIEQMKSKQAAEFPSMRRGQRARGREGRGRRHRRRKRKKKKEPRRGNKKEAPIHKQETTRHRRASARATAFSCRRRREKGQECCPKGCTVIRQIEERSWHRAGNRGLATQFVASNPHQQRK
jgi:hypothetical protein